MLSSAITDVASETWSPARSSPVRAPAVRVRPLVPDAHHLTSAGRHPHRFEAPGEPDEKAAGVDLGELAGISDEHDLGAGPTGGAEESGEGSGAGHAGVLRVDGRNVFIAEIKIWNGAKAFAATTDQLLGYTVWRDSKAVLIFFIETKNASAVIDKAAAAIAEHVLHRKTLSFARARPDERRDFVFEGDADPARDIHLTYLPFVLRPSADAETTTDR